MFKDIALAVGDVSGCTVSLKPDLQTIRVMLGWLKIDFTRAQADLDRMRTKVEIIERGIDELVDRPKLQAGHAGGDGD